MFYLFTLICFHNYTVIADCIYIYGDGEIFDSDIAPAASNYITNAVVNAPITILGVELFTSFSKLSNVILPDTLTTIRSKCFQSTSLKTLHLPKSVSSIDTSYLFYASSELESITVDPESTYYSSINGVLYSFDQKTLVCIPRNVKSLTLPETLETWGFWSGYGVKLPVTKIPSSLKTFSAYSIVDGSIEGFQFDADSKLTEISIDAFWQVANMGIFECPNGVTEIKASSFQSCGILKFICSEDSKMVIFRYNAFARCSELNEVVLPSQFEGFDTVCFSGCLALAKISFHGTPQNFLMYEGDWYTKDKKWLIFADPSKNEITIPSETSIISIGALKNISSIIMYDNNFFGIHENVLYSPDYTKIVIAGGLLEELSVHSSCETIPSSLFYGFPKLRSVKFEGNNIETIGESTFLDCQNLKDVTFASSIKEIQHSAFRNTGITKVVLPRSLERISNICFAFCKNLIEIDYEEGCLLRTIGQYAFREAPLKKVRLPDTVVLLDIYAFQLSSIPEIHLPLKLSTIKDNGFSNCKLQSVTCSPECCLRTLELRVFSNNNNLKYVELPPTLEIIGSNCFLNCPLLEKITWHTSTANPVPLLTTIEGGAFQNCKSIKNFTVFANLNTISQICFTGCENFVKYEVSGDKGNFKADNGVLYKGTVLQCFPQGRESCVIRSDTTEIAPNVFFESTKLVEVEFPPANGD